MKLVGPTADISRGQGNNLALRQSRPTRKIACADQTGLYGVAAGTGATHRLLLALRDELGSLRPLLTQSGHSGGYAILSCAAWRALSCENPSELSTMQLIKSW